MTSDGYDYTASTQSREAIEFGYRRLFASEDAGIWNTDDLVELGETMTTEEVLSHSRDDSRIPAGYTYLGQILAHELTFDRTQGLPTSPQELGQIRNSRCPLLDLSSIYGDGPDGTDHVLFEADGVRLKLGSVTGAQGSNREDLPRASDGVAIVADERNDENLVTAQTLVAIIKFHNAVADRLDGDRVGGAATFEEVRACVVQHFQSVVLHDLLWRLVPDDVYHDVLTNGRRLYYPDGLARGELPVLPIEFSHAAFRFGHSMVRTLYRWNDSIETAGPEQFFRNTARNAHAGFNPLSSDWVIDWRNFYDFSMVPGAERRKQINYSRRIDTRMSRLFGTLPRGERSHGEPPNLAVRDLLRGCAAGLPSGQQAADECRRRFGIYVGSLSRHELAAVGDDATRRTLTKRRLDERTPLWFYILAEAEVEQRGECLGRLGGRLVMEVLHGLIQFSKCSILSMEDWRPTLPAQRDDMFGMVDLLTLPV